jgi:hypothetical protein
MKGQYAIHNSEQSDVRIPDPGFWNDGQRLLSPAAHTFGRGVLCLPECSAVAKALKRDVKGGVKEPCAYVQGSLRGRGPSLRG